MQKYKESLIWQNLFYATDGMEPVGIGLCAFHIDTVRVKCINTHLAGRVDDTSVAKANTDMYYPAVSVLEESEVVALHIAEAYLVATRDLLRSIAWQPYTHSLKTYLCKSGTIDATN